MRKNSPIVALLCMILLAATGCTLSEEKACPEFDRQMLPVASFALAEDCEPERLYKAVKLNEALQVPAGSVSMILDNSMDSSILIMRYDSVQKPFSLNERFASIAKALRIQQGQLSENDRYSLPDRWPEVRAHFNRQLTPAWWDPDESDSGKQFWIQDPDGVSGVHRTKGLLLFYDERALYLFHWNFQHFGHGK